VSDVKRSVFGTAIAVALAAVALVAVPGSPAAAADAATAAFTPVRPCRLADTRELGTGFTRLDASTVRIPIAGRCGLPDAATAATLTVTITDARAPGFATVYPTGAPRPLTTAGNVRAGETRATSTIARLGDMGSVDIYVSMNAQVVVDVTGGFVPAAAATSGRFVPFGPERLADTRTLGTQVQAGGQLAIPLPGVPVDTVAVAVNVTITNTAGAGFATAFPSGDTLPPTSTVNSDARGQTRSATVIVAVSSSGLSVQASSAADVVVDIFGYFTGRSATAASTGLFTAIDPVRVLDTRGSSPLGNGVPLYPTGGLELPLPGNNAIAAYMVAAVDASPGFVSAFPAGTERPDTASATISTSGETVANLAFSQLSTRGLAFYSHATAHVVVDLAGWFSGIAAIASLPPPLNIAPPAPHQGPIEYIRPAPSGCTAHVPVVVPKADGQAIGASVSGRPIIAEHYGDPDGVPVLVVGPAHGDECSALAVVERIRANGRAGMLPPGIHLVVIPTLNPDGIIGGTRRNANGLDLNRDGLDVTQPETAALMGLTRALQPIATVHLHSPLSTVGGQGGPFGLGAFMAALIAERTGMHQKRTAGTGTPFLWIGQTRIVPAMATVLVETPRGYPGEAVGATGQVWPGPVPGDALWQTTADAIMESFSLV